MTEEERRTYPHRLYAHWNAGDMESFYAMLDENVVDVGGESQGRAGVRGILDHIRSAMPDFHYTVDQVIVDGEWLAVRLTATATQTGPLFGWPPTHRRATWKEIRYCRIVNNLTVEHHACLDNMGMLAQLGHVQLPERANW
jgi:predicted ester cyclase